MATTDITWHTPRVLLFSLFVSLSAKPKLNSWVEELKPYNSSAKENQRASGTQTVGGCVVDLACGTCPQFAPLMKTELPRPWRSCTLVPQYRRPVPMWPLHWRTKFTEASDPRCDPGGGAIHPSFLWQNKERRFVRRLQIKPYCFFSVVALIYYSATSHHRRPAEPSLLLWM